MTASSLQAALRAEDNRRLEERLAGTRDSNRFPGKRIAGLEAELLATSRGQREAP
ncbi:MAG: hypothetical protein ACREOE_00355 [Gemmatimonadales bacterium]